MFEAFSNHSVAGPAGRLHTRLGGQGAQLLLLHGHPQSQAMWHRVAHRLAQDHAERVERLMLLDIAPTLAMYDNTSEAFARASDSSLSFLSFIQSLPEGKPS